MAKHSGGCHCSKVRYEVDADIGGVIACNCSICQKTGTLLTFVPAASFTLLQGDEALTDYQFNRNVIHHLFCNTCGIRSFARGVGPDGSPMAAINARCLDDFEADKYPVHNYDGRAH